MSLDYYYSCRVTVYNYIKYMTIFGNILLLISVSTKYRITGKQHVIVNCYVPNCTNKFNVVIVVLYLFLCYTLNIAVIIIYNLLVNM